MEHKDIHKLNRIVHVSVRVCVCVCVHALGS